MPLIRWDAREELGVDRYVLIRTLPDGTPAAVQPVRTLEKAVVQLKHLNRSDGCWHIFDLHENRVIEPGNN